MNGRNTIAAIRGEESGVNIATASNYVGDVGETNRGDINGDKERIGKTTLRFFGAGSILTRDSKDVGGSDVVLDGLVEVLEEELKEHYFIFH